MLETNKIYQGDCLELIDNIKKADLVFTSPPYNMRTRIRNGKYTTREKSEHFSRKYKSFDDALSIEDYYNFHKKVIEKLLNKSKIIVYNIQIVTGSKEAWFKLIGYFSKYIKDIIVWDKGNGQPAMHDKVLNRCYELLLILEKDEKAGRVIQNSDFKRGELNDIWRIKRANNLTDKHTAIFPIALAEKVIVSFSREGDLILDNFMGLGTTALACIKTKRNFIGFEISEEYCKIANSRIQKELSQTKLNLEVSIPPNPKGIGYP
jgi:site-specific DNA-methyltransferase (adenine-specific)/modification methylase